MARYRSKSGKKRDRSAYTAKVIERHREAAMPYDGDSNDDDELTAVIQGFSHKEPKPQLEALEKVHGKAKGRWSDRFVILSAGYSLGDGTIVVFQKRIGTDNWNRIE